MTTSIKRTRLPGWAKLLTAVVILIVVLLAALRMLVFGGWTTCSAPRSTTARGRHS